MDLFNGFTEKQDDTEQYLYHYTTLETLLKYILPQKSIRFSPIRKTNDPQESNGRNFQLKDDIGIMATENIDKKHINQFLQNQTMYKDALNKNIKILCFTQDYVPEYNDSFCRDIGRGYAKPRMWSQYSDNHKGVCLVFNKKKLIKYFDTKYNNYFHEHGSISYKFKDHHHKLYYSAYTLLSSELKKYNNVQDIIYNRRKKYSDMYYFFKHPDWQEEREYRFLLDYSEDTYPIIEIDGLLEGIILGERSDITMETPIKILTEIFSHKPLIGKLIWVDTIYMCHPLHN